MICSFSGAVIYVASPFYKAFTIMVKKLFLFPPKRKGNININIALV